MIDFFGELDHGRLRAVSYVKPDSFVDGHPGYSKLDLFEGMIAKILDRLHAHPELFNETAVVITFDEAAATGIRVSSSCSISSATDRASVGRRLALLGGPPCGSSGGAPSA